MPYIPKHDRIRVLANNWPKTEGELNYLITSICLEYIMDKGKGYSTYNTVIGALESAKLELYRKQISKYEDLKCKMNGEVYDE